ncbi:MAG: hypothetical protein J5I90_12670 [Caldilineales bacterium]|nr:hypothetical protein [Caldilineales bacterium]
MDAQENGADYISLHFIGESITVQFDHPPVLGKKQGCPDAFNWQDDDFRIVALLSEWHDYGRRGRMASNMRPEHAATAAQRGSWGVGRDYYRVRVQTGRIFDIYYDRAPRNTGDRLGGWFLFQEMTPA